MKSLDSKYNLLPQKLGKGAFGEVYRGVDIHSQKKVAIKIVQGSLTMNKKEISILQTLQQISHESLLQYYGAYQYNQKTAIVMEEFGVSLENILQKNRRPSNHAALTILLNIAKSLQPIYQAGILHRDLKLSNILIEGSESEPYGQFKIKICDFGLAEKHSETKKYEKQRVGTLFFQPPEVLQFQEYSEKSEIWSLGLIFYMLIYGESPYPRQAYTDASHLYSFILENPFKFKKVEKSIAQIGESCLSISSVKRITLIQLIEKIENYLKGDITRQFCSLSLNDCSHGREQNENSQRKSSVQTIQTGSNQEMDTELEDLVMKLSSELHVRIQILSKESGFRAKICEDIRRISKRYMEYDSDDKENQEKQLATDLILIRKYIGKLKIVCELMQKQGDILANIKEYMLIDSLFHLHEAFKMLTQLSENQQKMQSLKEHLEWKGKQKNIEDYLKLRSNLLTFGTHKIIPNH